MASYDVFQQTFALSQLSNKMFGAQDTQANLQANLQSVLSFYLDFPAIGGKPATTASDKVTPLLGEWSVVWGPLVWKNRPKDAKTGPDNVVMVTHCPSVQFPDGDVREMYVVAVAGTAMHSTYDQLDEDLGVSSVVDYAAWQGNKDWLKSGAHTPAPTPIPHVLADVSYISNGTAQGVYQLLSNASPAGAVQAGVYLGDFLAGIGPKAKSSTIVFTGHSLGGALSPTLAQLLVDTGKLMQFGADNILVYPTAGPMPGNRKFADRLNATFPLPAKSPAPGSGYNVWNAGLRNTNDVVPYAWGDDKTLKDQHLGLIPGLYRNNPPLQKVKDYVDAAAAKRDSTGCHYYPFRENPFTADLVNQMPVGTEVLDITPPPADTYLFELQAFYQHIPAYNAKVGYNLPPSPTESAQQPRAGVLGLIGAGAPAPADA